MPEAHISGIEREVESVRSLIMVLLSHQEPLRSGMGGGGQGCINNTAGSDDTDLMRCPGTAQDQPKHLLQLTFPCPSTVSVQRHVSEPVEVYLSISS